MEVAGRVAVVTGGGSGIGRALCNRFAAGGAKVVVADIDGAAARRVASEVGGLPVTADVSREAAVKDVVARTLAEHGRLDVFCSNAGIAVGGGPEAPDADWQRIWEVNVLAHVLVARHALPHLLAHGEGYLLGTVSAAGLLNHVLAAPYGVTKAAALSLFEWLSIAHGDHGLHVSCLCPQGVRTPMLAADPSGFLDAGALEPEQVAEVVVEGMRAERFLILPHPQVAEYFQRKAADYDRWLRGMRRLRGRILGQ
ncbi:MAG TPA: SDR family oxidoreductase [Candidatus Acidoferrales bacterium]|nr:SDR family oxidoreductase [Candidatus Acidoferrales bacterium]